MTEDELLASFFDWCRWMQNTDPRYGLVVHVPNEGRRSWAEGKRMKRKGLVAGVPDVLVLHPGNGYPGLALEFKVGRGKLTPAQYEWRLKLLSAGWQHEVITTFDQAKSILERYFK